MASWLNSGTAILECDGTLVAANDALAAWQLPRATQPTKLAEMDPVFRQTLTGILQQPWWWWTMLGAALALSAETIWLTVRRANE